jgi:hypothetical protein
MKWVFNFVGDKLLRLLFLFEFRNDQKRTYKSNYEYHKNFLGNVDFSKEASMFQPLVAELGSPPKKIYNIKTSVYADEVVKKADYYIRNHFWGLFHLLDYSGDELNDEDYFSLGSIRVYLLMYDEHKHIAIVRSRREHFDILKTYKYVRVSPRVFKDRQLVYSKDLGYVAI